MWWALQNDLLLVLLPTAALTGFVRKCETASLTHIHHDTAYAQSQGALCRTSIMI